MKKAMISSVIGLMVLSLVALSFTFIKPVEQEQHAQTTYAAIEKFEQKQQTIRYMADQAITDAIIDIILLKAAIDNTQCTPNSVNEITLEEKIAEYFIVINEAEENQSCTVKLDELELISPPVGSGKQSNTIISIDCNLTQQNPNSGNLTEAIRIKKLQSQRKSFDTSVQPGVCFVLVKDLDSGIVVGN